MAASGLVLLAAAAPPSAAQGIADRTPAMAVGVPAAVTQRYDQIRVRFRAAEAALMANDLDGAAAIAGEIEQRLESLQEEYGAAIPRDHVAAFVLEEQLSSFRQRLDRRSSGPR
jgi:hypothetical protein